MREHYKLLKKTLESKHEQVYSITQLINTDMTQFRIKSRTVKHEKLVHLRNFELSF